MVSEWGRAINEVELSAERIKKRGIVMRKPMFVFAVLAAALALAPAAAQQRFALVIGNAAYRYLPTLPNTVNDAE